MRVNHWDNGKSEIYCSIPVEFPNCEQQVSVTGYLEEGKMRLEPCPSCGTELSLEVLFQDKEESTNSQSAPKQYIARAVVNWFYAGGAVQQQSVVLGDTPNIYTLLLNVLNNGVLFYAPGTQSKLHGAIAQFVLQNWVPKNEAREIISAILSGFDAENVDDSVEKTNNKVLNIDDILNLQEDDEPEDDDQ